MANINTTNRTYSEAQPVPSTSCDNNNVQLNIVPNYSGIASSIVNDKGIINLSSLELSEADISLLSKGLSFCPSTRNLDMGDISASWNKFQRSLRLKHFFQNDNSDTQGNSMNYSYNAFEHRKFKEPSNFTPPMASMALEHFIAQTRREINDLPYCKTKKHNLTNAERAALHKLANNDNIIIRPADKGGATVIMNTCDYISEAKRQLSDSFFYQPLEENLTKTYNREINNFLYTLHNNGEIGPKCYEYLHRNHTKAGRFYTLPKVHKNVLPPPGRPIISAIGSPTERISQFVDHFLQPILPTLKSYVKDTGHFLYLISKITDLPPNAQVGTLDVTSLYTNVPLLGAKRAVAKGMSSRPRDALPRTSSIIKLIDLIFTRNVFTFSDGQELKYYVQKNGISMGSKCSPSLACIYMGEFERTHVYTYKNKPFLWLRYIDDVFLIWTHGEELFNEFLAHLNSRVSTIKFTGSLSPIHKGREYLDTSVYIENNKLISKLFIKPTNALSYLHRDSFHAKSTFSSLPLGEFIRARRNCTHTEIFLEYSLKIKEAFINRGYDPIEVEEARQKALAKDRTDMLNSYDPSPNYMAFRVIPSSQESTLEEESPVHMTTMFHPDTARVRNIISRNWEILSSSNATRILFDSKVIYGNRRNKRLRDILVKSSIPIKTNPALCGSKITGATVCTTNNCSYCPRLDTSGKIVSTTLKREFTAKKNVTCKSSNVVYCIQCLICNKQYVGETLRPFMKRFYEHSKDVRDLNPDHTFGLHFRERDHCNKNDPDKYLKAWILAYITAPPQSKNAHKMRLKFEDQWVNRLRTALPMGLNSKETAPKKPTS